MESRRRQAVHHNDTTARDDDAVGVAVVNYRMPRLRTQLEVLANAHKIRQMIEGLKLGLPGLDLVIFPAYSTHGLLHDGAEAVHVARGIPGDETAVLARACRNAGVWGVFSLTATHAAARLGQAPGNTLILMNDRGEIVQTQQMHRAGQDGKPGVCPGPKGMTVMLAPDDGDATDESPDGQPELIVGCPGEPDAAPTPQALARARHSYVAVANASGFDGMRCHFGRSAVIGFDGHTLGECGEEDYGIQFVQLSKRLIRQARGLAAEEITSENCGPRSPRAGRVPAGDRPQAPA
jgi:amidase